VADGEPVAEAEVVAAGRARIEIERHRLRLGVRAHQVQVDGAAFLSDQHRAGEQIAGVVADLDGVEHGFAARLFWPERAETDLRAEESEREARQRGEEDRWPAARGHADSPSRNTAASQTARSTSSQPMAAVQHQ
jgi:hypothetical protein